jgi:hypothetical protein
MGESNTVHICILSQSHIWFPNIFLWKHVGLLSWTTRSLLETVFEGNSSPIFERGWLILLTWIPWKAGKHDCLIAVYLRLQNRHLHQPDLCHRASSLQPMYIISKFGSSRRNVASAWNLAEVRFFPTFPHLSEDDCVLIHQLHMYAADWRHEWDAVTRANKAFRIEGKFHELPYSRVARVLVLDLPANRSHTKLALKKFRFNARSTIDFEERHRWHVRVNKKPISFVSSLSPSWFIAAAIALSERNLRLQAAVVTERTWRRNNNRNSSRFYVNVSRDRHYDWRLGWTLKRPLRSRTHLYWRQTVRRQTGL